VKIGLRAALAHCCRFNERGLLHWPTDDWANDPDHRDDMFIHKLKDGTYRPCTLFGDMSPEALTVEGLRAMGESFKAKFMLGLDSNDVSNFSAGLAFCKKVAAEPWDPTYIGKLAGAPGATGWDAEHDMPSWSDSFGTYPVGYLTYGGLKVYEKGTTATTGTTTNKSIITNFLAVVDKMAAAFKSLFPRSRALDASAASSWIYKAKAEDAFFENCIFHSGAPVWLVTSRRTNPITVNGPADLEKAVSSTDFDGAINGLGFSDEMTTSLKAAYTLINDTSIDDLERNLDAFKTMVLGALSSSLQELNSGNNETASRLVRVINTMIGEIPDIKAATAASSAAVAARFPGAGSAGSSFKLLEVLLRLVLNMFKYRQAIKDVPTDQEMHFNAMYGMHRVLSKVTGDSLDPIVKSLYSVAHFFNVIADDVNTKSTADAKLKAAVVYFEPSAPAGSAPGTAKPDVISFVDGKFNAVTSVAGALVNVSNAPSSTGAYLGPTVKGYTRTRFTSIVDIADPKLGFVGIHPNAPAEYSAAVRHGANALNGTHPGGPAAMFGAFPPHHGGGGGRGGGHGGGFGHHAQHEGRHPPPFASKHHEHYHDEEEHGHDERPAQRQRGGFFGAPAYIRQDGTHVDNWDEVAPRPGNTGPHYGYEGAPPPQGRYAPAYGRRVGPIDEYGRMLTGEQEQERLGRRHREMAAEHSLDGDMSDNFADRYDYVLADSDPITRAAKLAFLASPIYRGMLENMIEKDIVFPFGFLLYRPFITHNMATAILTKKGAETGETLIGKKKRPSFPDVFVSHLRALERRPRRFPARRRRRAQNALRPRKFCSRACVCMNSF
jgi:hypothetical protein